MGRVTYPGGSEETLWSVFERVKLGRFLSTSELCEELLLDILNLYLKLPLNLDLVVEQLQVAAEVDEVLAHKARLVCVESDVAHMESSVES